MLLCSLPAPDAALRAHALSVVALEDGNSDQWFEHWCAMLDAIESAAPGDEMERMSSVTDALLGEHAPVFNRLTDDELKKIIACSVDDATLNRAFERGVDAVRNLLASL
ncbi:hypothetical protein D0962_03120 [Leptolyngbyaceae cyanobacterium CCMR0082]|uniref:Uncharacterized protein n=1 Tax=Adonisia turfae CCMR0082 TaxID=2304604 RepID=A0A6M0RZZ4_9CYAN|nr:hypothetical protein [Adonisia turfae]NEZ61774.1 hypothetical protein [Adonisia turfae CCMR0082]